MLKNKKIVVLLSIVGVLVLMTLVTKVKKQVSMAEMAKLETLMPKDLSLDNLDKITVYIPPKAGETANTNSNENESADKTNSTTASEHTIILSKNAENKWLLPDFSEASADLQKVTELFNNLKSLQGEFRSNSADVLGDYNLKDEEAMKISLYKKGADKPAWEILVGKTDAYMTHFARLQGTNKVYIIPTDLRSQVGGTSSDLNKSPDYKKFVDLKLLTFNREDLTEFSLNSPHNSVTLERREVEEPVPATEKNDNTNTSEPPKTQKVKRWFVKDSIPYNLSSNGGENLINRFSNITASDIEAKRSEMENDLYGLKNPTYTLNLKTSQGKEVKLLIGNEVKKTDGTSTSNYYAITDDSSSIVSIPTDTINRIFYTWDDSFELSLFTIPENSISSVVSELKNPYSLSSSDGKTFKLAGEKDDTKLNQDKISSITQNLMRFKAEGFANKVSDLEKVVHKLTVTEKGGNSYELLVGAKDKPLAGITMAKLSKTDGVFFINSTSVDRLFPVKSELLEATAPAMKEQ